MSEQNDPGCLCPGLGEVAHGAPGPLLLEARPRASFFSLLGCFGNPDGVFRLQCLGWFYRPRRYLSELSLLP